MSLKHYIQFSVLFQRPFKMYRQIRSALAYLCYSHLPTFLYPWALKCWYYKHTKRKLDLQNPWSFNDKIQWSKLYDSTPIKTKLADKYAVREWVKEKIGMEYLIPLVGVYERSEDIDFNTLPNQFVIKCNHGSGYNIIVKDKSKLNLKTVRQNLNKWMQENFAFKSGFELHYSPIKPIIMIEKYMEDEAGGGLLTINLRVLTENLSLYGSILNVA